ncbi:transcriptional regulator, TetR family [Beutenbergia cavernae DSM 12333]|uniref:Transcriptional regulator, TetR family n=1 Tax=Beutenbergia cavernae (strain ATCC BAA-8 / DSM 12333 / CCUG 43141 / JCM 11478 / NBRC 16432 / NCIMB 13614 / HKI 0122) TaxID=471853 RepID=C5C5W5_BEUC1|nr:TetR/AcrR family transcriptional regulator [Beutenbergia cavernae]ACQ82323.1 transcriptional regulator, TetR family [Beutenbergia cavernae DSM 12333]
MSVREDERAMSDDDAPALPHAVALAWGLAARPQRPPRGELSTERIVEAAVQIADAEGLAAVSMSKVATSLGYTTMSLYRYVTSKDDLLELMADAVQGEAVLPPAADAEDLARGVDPGASGAPDGGGWRSELRAWLLTLAGIFEAHPWITEVPISGPPVTPNALRIVEHGLRALRDAPFDDEEKIGVILMGTNLMTGYGVVEQRLKRGDASSDVGAAMLELVTPEQFPYLRPLFERGSYAGTDDLDTSPELEFAVERVLDGVAHLIATRASGEPPANEADDVAAENRRTQLYRTDKKVREAAKRRREAEKKLREELKRERDVVREAEKKLLEAERKAAEQAAKV